MLQRGKIKRNNPLDFFQLLLGLNASWAGPPYFTDDPEPVEYKHGELYVSTQFQNPREGQSAVLPLIDFNYARFKMASALSLDGPPEPC